MAGRSRYDIVCPRLKTTDNAAPVDRLVACKSWIGQHDLVCVSSKSPKSHKRAVETLAWYFKREFGYDFVQYVANERTSDEETLAFFWHSGYEPELSVVGACCFRWRDYENFRHCWAMQWIWMHPYCRGKGLLTKAWPLFEEAFGPFHVERPLSQAMEGFLKDKACEVVKTTTGDEIPLYGSGE